MGSFECKLQHETTKGFLPPRHICLPLFLAHVRVTFRITCAPYLGKEDSMDWDLMIGKHITLPWNMIDSLYGSIIDVVDRSLKKIEEHQILFHESQITLV